MKRAEALSFGERGRLPANWHGLCSNESCVANASYRVDGLLFCKRHAAAFALETLLEEESSHAR
jgi:hypothetical protein